MEKLGVKSWEAEYEQWKTEQIEFAGWELEVKALMMKKMKELGIEPPPDKPGQGQGGGRPNTHSKPAHMEQKGSQSGHVRSVQSKS